MTTFRFSLMAPSQTSLAISAEPLPTDPKNIHLTSMISTHFPFEDLRLNKPREQLKAYLTEPNVFPRHSKNLGRLTSD